MASRGRHGISNHGKLNRLFNINNLFGLPTKKISKLSIIGSLWGELAGEFQPQKASNADGVSMSCHCKHAITFQNGANTDPKLAPSCRYWPGSTKLWHVYRETTEYANWSAVTTQTHWLLKQWHLLHHPTKVVTLRKHHPLYWPFVTGTYQWPLVPLTKCP